MFNHAVLQKEQLLERGKLILLELAPVDPRSLIQGDYMRLDYAILLENKDDEIEKRGYVVVNLDDQGVAQAIRVQKGPKPLKDDEHIIKYTTNWDQEKSIGSESYFFQEGEDMKFDSAKYGGLKVDDEGNSILIGLYDVHRNRIK